VVIAIDEIHVGVTGRTEENGIPRSPARGRVRRRIAFAEIGFGFDNSSRQNSAGRFPDQQFSEQRPRHPAGIAIEEVRFQHSNAAGRFHVHQAMAKSRVAVAPAAAELRSAWTPGGGRPYTNGSPQQKSAFPVMIKQSIEENSA